MSSSWWKCNKKQQKQFSVYRPVATYFELGGLKQIETFGYSEGRHHGWRQRKFFKFHLPTLPEKPSEVVIFFRILTQNFRNYCLFRGWKLEIQFLKLVSWDNLFVPFHTISCTFLFCSFKKILFCSIVRIVNPV